MKIVKPLTLGTLHKPFSWRGRHQLVVSALGFFPLDGAAHARLLPEPGHWPAVLAALPAQRALDEVCPKAQAEALVLGPLPEARDGKAPRLQIGLIDKTAGTFGPLPIDAPERMRHAGTYPPGCAAELAADADLRLFNQAPEDQRLAGPAWPGGSAYALHHMCEGQPLLAGRLPAMRARAFVLDVDAPADALREVGLSLDTVWFIPAARLGVLAWHGCIDIAESDALDVQALMIAYEPDAEPRPLAHYAQVLALRLDPDTAGAHAFNEAQLAPARSATELARQAADSPSPEAAAPPALQAPSAAAIASGDFDLSGLLASAQTLADQTRAQAEAKRAELEREHPLPEPPPPAGPESTCSWDEVLHRATELPRPELARARCASPTPLTSLPKLPAAIASRLGFQALAWVAQGESLAGRDLAGADLRGACLAGVDLSGCLLEAARLDGADLRGARLDCAVLTQASLVGAQLAGASLREANLCGCQATGVQLDSATLQGAQASGAQLDQAVGRDVDWSEARLDQASLRGARFDGANLQGCLLTEASLDGSRWHGARFTRCVAWQLRAPQADFSASEWTRSALLKAELAGSCWRGARFVQLQGGWSDWSGADFEGAHAEHSGWPQARLEGARLANAVFVRCDFGRADLTGAVLEGGCFARSLFLQTGLRRVQARAADFFQALLRKADLRDANVREAGFMQADTAGLRWPEPGAAP
ncbi:pentapeptide repeat-containing protein [Burkholderiaceae bacterium UC74_6]